MGFGEKLNNILYYQEWGWRTHGHGGEGGAEVVLGAEAGPGAGVGLRPPPGQTGLGAAARRVAVVVHVDTLRAVVRVTVLSQDARVFNKLKIKVAMKYLWWTLHLKLALLYGCCRVPPSGIEPWILVHCMHGWIRHLIVVKLFSIWNLMSTS